MSLEGISFLELSKVLTGFDSLDSRMADSLLVRAKASPFGTDVTELIRQFEKIASVVQSDNAEEEELLKLLDNNAALRAAAEQLIFLWYLSAEADGMAWRFGSEEEYAGGLLWRAIAAHPPGLSGGYMGQWRYMPGNLE